MKRILLPIGIMFIMSLICGSILAETQSTTEEWVDVTEKVYANPTSSQGWKLDEKAKVYKDSAGMNIKVNLSELGIYFVDLKLKKVYELNSDGSKKEIEVTKIFQRDHGFSLVFRTEKVKVRCRLKEKIEGMKNLEGMKAL